MSGPKELTTNQLYSLQDIAAGQLSRFLDTARVEIAVKEDDGHHELWVAFQFDRAMMEDIARTLAGYRMFQRAMKRIDAHRLVVLTGNTVYSIPAHRETKEVTA